MPTYIDKIYTRPKKGTCQTSCFSIRLLQIKINLTTFIMQEISYVCKNELKKNKQINIFLNPVQVLLNKQLLIAKKGL